MVPEYLSSPNIEKGHIRETALGATNSGPRVPEFPEDLRRQFRERALGAMNSGPRVPEFPEDPRRQFRERALGAMNSGPQVPEFLDTLRRLSSERGRSGLWTVVPEHPEFPEDLRSPLPVDPTRAQR